jgi:rubrerythrin
MSTSIDLQNLYNSLRLEIAAVERYQDHQDKTSDPIILALLQGLMRNEDGHELDLIAQINRLGGDPKEAEKLLPPALPNMVYDGNQIKGQKTNLAMLRADFAFESEATKLYADFAAQTDDEELKKLFAELSRAERGHVNGLRTLIKGMEEGTHEVAFFCPVCGWSVPFGASPETGAESRCKMCGALFTLKEEDGDFAVERN